MGRAAGVLGTVVMVVAIAGCGNSDFRTYSEPGSPSMLPTIKAGESFTVDLRKRSPIDGQIIVFYVPRGADSLSPTCGDPKEGAGHPQACGVPTPQRGIQVFVKRVVAVGGQSLRIVDGRAIVDGRPQPDSFTKPCGAQPECNFPQPIVIPAGDYFLLGDNRGESDDSRFWGPVPKADIIGTVVNGG